MSALTILQVCAQCQLSSDQITTLTTPAATSVEEYIKDYSNQLKNVLQMCVEQQNTLPPVSNIWVSWLNAIVVFGAAPKFLIPSLRNLEKESFFAASLIFFYNPLSTAAGFSSSRSSPT